MAKKREEKLGEFLNALKKGRGEGKIKVAIKIDPPFGNINSESVWAEPLGDNRAKVLNIPFFLDWVGLDDIIEVRGEGFNREYVRTLEVNSHTAALVYNKGQNEEVTKKNCKEARDYLEEKGIKTEPAVAGILAVSIPLAHNPDETEKALNATPHLIEHSFHVANPEDSEEAE